MNVILDQAEYEYLLGLFDWQDYNAYPYDKQTVKQAVGQGTIQDDMVLLQMNPEMRSVLLDFIDDKKTEYGFDDAFDVNEEGQRLTRLWDSIFSNTD